MTTMRVTVSRPRVSVVHPAAAAGGSVTSVDGQTGAVVLSGVYQGLHAFLTALKDLSTTGLIARTGSGAVSTRTITAPAAGITVSNGDGVSGNPTLALANDLSALEALSGTGLSRRTGTDAWSVGTTVSIAEGGTGATDAAAARAALGIPEPIVLNSSPSDSASAGFVTAGNLTFTPVAGAVYLIQVFGVFSSAAAGTGMFLLMNPGNGTGGWEGRVRGSSATAASILIGTMDGTTGAGAVGVSAPAGGLDCWYMGQCILLAHASAPTAFSVGLQSEVAASAVTFPSGRSVLLIRRLS